MSKSQSNSNTIELINDAELQQFKENLASREYYDFRAQLIKLEVLHATLITQNIANQIEDHFEHCSVTDLANEPESQYLWIIYNMWSVEFDNFLPENPDEVNYRKEEVIIDLDDFRETSHKGEIGDIATNEYINQEVSLESVTLSEEEFSKYSEFISEFISEAFVDTGELEEVPEGLPSRYLGIYKEALEKHAAFERKRNEYHDACEVERSASLSNVQFIFEHASKCKGQSSFEFKYRSTYNNYFIIIKIMRVELENTHYIAEFTVHKSAGLQGKIVFNKPTIMDFSHSPDRKEIRDAIEGLINQTEFWEK